MRKLVVTSAVGRLVDGFTPVRASATWVAQFDYGAVSWQLIDIQGISVDIRGLFCGLPGTPLFL